MAYFAQIDHDGIVQQVISISNDDAPGPASLQSEKAGQAFIANVLGLPGTWMQTSYNTHGGVHANGGTPFRYNYAGIAYTFSNDRQWSAQKGAFISPKPFPSWILNPATAVWEAPVPIPDPDLVWEWDEENQTWVECVMDSEGTEAGEAI